MSDLRALAFDQTQGGAMRQTKLNDHGQPFSKKQRKASRHMMAMRRGDFIPRDPGFKAPKLENGMLAALMGVILGAKSRMNFRKKV